MNIRDLGEFPFLRRLHERLPPAFHASQIRLGVGDDCAALSLPGTTVLTTDALIEGVHFQTDWASFETLGRKAFAVNASDIAAMGGEPTFALLNVGAPQDSRIENLDAFFDGFVEAARAEHTALIGGNMSAARVLTIAVTLLGHAAHGLVSRAGAQVDDDLYVTGNLGDAAVGLRLLTGELDAGAETTSGRDLTQRFLLPTARMAIGRQLTARRLATAMIDVSDGLLQDLGHLCEASRVGAVVAAHRLPVSDGYRAINGDEDYSLALAGGEDYELLFSAPPAVRPAIPDVALACGCPISRIGRVRVPGEGIRVVMPDGAHPASEFAGFDHFSRGPV